MKADRTAFCVSISARNSGTFHIFLKLKNQDLWFFDNQILESDCMLVASRRFDEGCGSYFSIDKSITGVLTCTGRR